MMLQRKGHRVLADARGKTGMEVFRRERPDATILDLEMPEMDGLAVLRQIREDDPKAPVIMLTGAGTDELEKKARALGVTQFFAKGFSLHELGAALALVVTQPDEGAAGSPARQRLSWVDKRGKR